MSTEENVICSLVLLYAYKRYKDFRKSKKWWTRSSLNQKMVNTTSLLSELRESSTYTKEVNHLLDQ